jgi:hypothetical protein
METQRRVRVGREEWAKRVQRWRDSGLTCAEFAAELGINPRTLTYWKWVLEKEARGEKRAWPARKRRESALDEAVASGTTSDRARVQGGGGSFLQGRGSGDDQVALDLDLTETALREWVKRADGGKRTGAQHRLTLRPPTAGATVDVTRHVFVAADVRAETYFLSIRDGARSAPALQAAFTVRGTLVGGTTF